MNCWVTSQDTYRTTLSTSVIILILQLSSVSKPNFIREQIRNVSCQEGMIDLSSCHFKSGKVLSIIISHGIKMQACLLFFCAFPRKKNHLLWLIIQDCGYLLISFLPPTINLETTPEKSIPHPIAVFNLHTDQWVGGIKSIFNLAHFEITFMHKGLENI